MAVVALAVLLGASAAGCAPPADDERADDEQADDDEAVDAGSAGSSTSVAGGGGTPALAPAPGFDGLVVKVGIVGPVEEEILDGQRAYWRYVNDRLGGVGARFPVDLDEVRSPDRVAVIAHASDAALVDGLLEDLREEEVLASPGSRAARWSDHPSLLPVGVPEPEQLAAAERWLAEQGRELPGACIVAAAGDTPEVVVAEAVGARCDAVVLRGRPGPVAAVLDAAAAVEAPVSWVVLADGWSPALDGRDVQQRVAVVQERTCAPDCEAERGATGRELADPWFRYGWTQARVAHQVLEEALESGGLDRASIAAAARSLASVELDGVMPSWSYGGPDGRRPPTDLAVYAADATTPITEIGSFAVG